MGALDLGFPMSHVGFKRNVNVACLCRLFRHMSPCHMSNLGNRHVSCHYFFLPLCCMSLSLICRMSNLRKAHRCRCVKFRGLGQLCGVLCRNKALCRLCVVLGRHCGWKQSGVCLTGILWPLTPKIDRGTWAKGNN